MKYDYSIAVSFNEWKEAVIPIARTRHTTRRCKHNSKNMFTQFHALMHLKSLIHVNNGIYIQQQTMTFALSESINWWDNATWTLMHRNSESIQKSATNLDGQIIIYTYRCVCILNSEWDRWIKKTLTIDKCWTLRLLKWTVNAVVNKRGRERGFCFFPEKTLAISAIRKHKST